MDITQGNRRLQDHAVPVRLVARELRGRGKVDTTPSHPTISWLHLLRLKDDFGGLNIGLVVEYRASGEELRANRDERRQTATKAHEDEDESEGEGEGEGDDNDDLPVETARLDCQ